MREFFSFCFEQLADSLSLPLNWEAEYIVLTFLGILAVIFAYRLVGGMYDADFICGGLAGSFFHWFLRAVIFVAPWGSANALIAVYRFVAEHWILLLAITGGVLLIVVAFFLTRYFVVRNCLKSVNKTIHKS